MQIVSIISMESSIRNLIVKLSVKIHEEGKPMVFKAKFDITNIKDYFPYEEVLNYILSKKGHLFYCLDDNSRIFLKSGDLLVSYISHLFNNKEEIKKNHKQRGQNIKQTIPFLNIE